MKKIHRRFHFEDGLEDGSTVEKSNTVYTERRLIFKAFDFQTFDCKPWEVNKFHTESLIGKSTRAD